ncbi:hypothetical protein M0R72_02840 [Candidatus Pacearchaeota archaeon]|jgi:hypothetical protein|nr:hypothetical protein [Candidatus Pacearchaeota archaeon]
MVTIREAIVQVVAEKLREYYLRGIRDARVEADENSMPSILEEFDAGEFEDACEQHVWLKIAENIIDM